MTVMMSVVMLHVVMLNVMAPKYLCHFLFKICHFFLTSFQHGCNQNEWNLPFENKLKLKNKILVIMNRFEPDECQHDQSQKISLSENQGNQKKTNQWPIL
jgi:hypothetical protein